MDLKNKNIGFAITASYCTFAKIPAMLEELKNAGANIFPIMSFNAANLDSRFQTAKSIKEEILRISGNEIIDTIQDAEPIGPKKFLDAMVIAPCTGNTLAKLACGITDTPVCMAAKAHLRNNKPILIGISTNDALSANAINIGRLLNTKGYYFIPFFQDDTKNKPCSLIADTGMLLPSLKEALSHRQIEPVLRSFKSFA